MSASHPVSLSPAFAPTSPLPLYWIECGWKMLSDKTSSCSFFLGNNSATWPLLYVWDCRHFFSYKKKNPLASVTSPWRAINDRNISIEPNLMCFKVEISTHDHTVHSAAILGNSVNNLAACFTCLIGSVCLSPRIVLWEWEMIHHILCIQHDPEVWIIKNHRTIFYLFII